MSFPLETLDYTSFVLLPNTRNALPGMIKIPTLSSTSTSGTCSETSSEISSESSSQASGDTSRSPSPTNFVNQRVMKREEQESSHVEPPRHFGKEHNAMFYTEQRRLDYISMPQNLVRAPPYTPTTACPQRMNHPPRRPRVHIKGRRIFPRPARGRFFHSRHSMHA